MLESDPDVKIDDNDEDDDVDADNDDKDDDDDDDDDDGVDDDDADADTQWHILCRMLTNGRVNSLFLNLNGIPNNLIQEKFTYILTN